MKALRLIVGAILMIVLGLVFKESSHVSVGLGLMWIAFASME